MTRANILLVLASLSLLVLAIGSFGCEGPVEYGDSYAYELVIYNNSESPLWVYIDGKLQDDAPAYRAKSYTISDNGTSAHNVVLEEKGSGAFVMDETIDFNGFDTSSPYNLEVNLNASDPTVEIENDSYRWGDHHECVTASVDDSVVKRIENEYYEYNSSVCGGEYGFFSVDPGYHVVSLYDSLGNLVAGGSQKAYNPGSDGYLVVDVK